MLTSVIFRILYDPSGYSILTDAVVSVADGIAVNDFVPPVVDTDGVGLIAGDRLGEHRITGAGTAADVDPGAVDPAIAELGVLPRSYLQVVFVHIAGF